MSKYFIASVKYPMQDEAGVIKAANEKYLVSAESVTDAEARVVEEVSPYSLGEITVMSVVDEGVDDIIIADAEKWYKAKIAYIELDEKSGKEKRVKSTIYVESDDLHSAVRAIENHMSGSMADWEFVSVQESKIVAAICSRDKTSESSNSTE